MNITSIKQQVKRKDRYSIFIDGVYICSLSESGLLSEGLHVGQALTSSEVSALKKTSGADKAYGNALRYVAIRLRSEWELRTYLQRKQVDEPVADTIIARLKKVQLLDDLAFARAWVANRRTLKSISKRKLQMELAQKHVPETIAREALSEDVVNERDALRELAQKKHARYPDRNKFMQYLARQGFGYDDISHVLAEIKDNSLSES
jgi:regulatory protein